MITRLYTIYRVTDRVPSTSWISCGFKVFSVELSKNSNSVFRIVLVTSWGSQIPTFLFSLLIASFRAPEEKLIYLILLAYNQRTETNLLMQVYVVQMTTRANLKTVRMANCKRSSCRFLTRQVFWVQISHGATLSAIQKLLFLVRMFLVSVL